jgi:hypothetical protein
MQWFGEAMPHLTLSPVTQLINGIWFYFNANAGADISTRKAMSSCAGETMKQGD